MTEVLLFQKTRRVWLMNELISDEKLVESAQAKDADAFGEIVRRFERKIFAVCLRTLGREEDARDAAQETFIAAYRNLGNFRGEAQFSSWLHRIAINQCISKQRRNKARPEIALEESEPTNQHFFAASPKSSPAVQSEQSERLATVRRAIEALPSELKQVVTMKEFEEMTFQEIADALGIPVSTVKSRLYTALRQLKARLEKLQLEVV